MKQSIVILLSLMSLSGVTNNSVRDKQRELQSNISILERQIQIQQELLDSISLDLADVELVITPELLHEINMDFIDN